MKEYQATARIIRVLEERRSCNSSEIVHWVMDRDPPGPFPSRKNFDLIGKCLYALIDEGAVREIHSRATRLFQLT